MRQRVEVHAHVFAELVVWLLPEPLAGSAHSFKYRLAYVVDGVCELRHDNEAGQGNHRHRDQQESRYRFKDPERLMADFFEDIQRYHHEHPHD